MQSKCVDGSRIMLGGICLLLIVTSGCIGDVVSMSAQIQGSGVVTNDLREVPSFHAIHLSGALRAEVKVGEERSVAVTGDDNIVPLILTEVRNGTLRATQKNNSSYSTDAGLKILITVSELTEIKISGASRGTVSGVAADRFSIEASGASRATLTGRAEALSIEASGASRVDAHELSAGEVHLEVSGASRAQVSASRSIKGQASGASRVRYSGSPESVDVDSSGASKVQPE